MRSMPRSFMAVTLGITLLAAGTASGDSGIVGGNVIVDRQFADTFQNFHGGHQSSL
jgi:hypothetical protein